MSNELTPLRLVTWNCQGGFRKKYPHIAALRPDIAVIQECEQVERIHFDSGQAPTTALWFGEKPARGLGVFSWTGLQFNLDPIYDPSIRYCVPLNVAGPSPGVGPRPFNLLAVWAMKNTQIAQFGYVGQVYRALMAYDAWIRCRAYTVITGDFNTRRQLEGLPRRGSRTSVVQQIANLALASAYHRYFNEKQGSESAATLYLQRKIERPFHIDYVFVPVEWVYYIRRVSVGDPADWLQHSDHCPVSVEIRGANA